MNRRLPFLLIILFCTLLWGCYEPIEGCLDTAATNYDVTADNSCNDCCTLPALALTMAYYYRGEPYRNGDTIMLSREESITIEDFHFWLTDINLMNDGATISFEDTLRVFDSADQEQWVEDNFRYFDLTNIRPTISGLRYTGRVNALTLKVGMTELINNYDIDSIRINSDLRSIPNGSYTPSSKFIFFQMTIKSITDETQIIEITNKYPLPVANIPLEETEVLRAENISIGIYIDFAEVLDGVSLSQSQESNQDIIWQNLSDSFFELR